MRLRPFQVKAKIAIQKAWETVKNTLLVLPTGTGKTIVFCHLCRDAVAEGKRVLILAHRGELLDQAADKMRKATGLECAVEKAQRSCLTAPDCWHRIVIGSVQTLMNQKRLDQFSPDYFDIIIVDEAHHALADSYKRILDHFADAKVLGVTATPDRGDRQQLGEYFESLAFEYSLPKAIKDGFLCKIVAETIPLKIDLTGVKTQAGDFQTKALGDVLEPYLGQIAKEVAVYAEDRKAVIFTPLIRTSEKLTELLIAEGVNAVEVNGKSKDRDQILEDFQIGEYQVLCNSMLLTEGWDCPSVDCIVCLRPTKIRSLYCQIIGRGTRIYPEKKDLLILDFLWHSERHELCRPAKLISKNKQIEDRITELVELSDEPLDIEEAEIQAEAEGIHEREEALARELKEMKTRTRTLVDPIQFEFSIQAEDLIDYVPTFAWEMGPPTEKQKKTLENIGIFPDQIECAGKASKYIDRLKKRRKEGLSTPKQIRFLEKKGFLHVGRWPFQDAMKMINRYAQNRWQNPYGIIPKEYTP